LGNILLLSQVIRFQNKIVAALLVAGCIPQITHLLLLLSHFILKGTLVAAERDIHLFLLW